jgi:hypothetical protein
MNGIEPFITANDLADRAVLISLPPLPEAKIKTKKDILKDFNQDVPIILGGLLTAVSTAMKRISKVKLDKTPRMADFAEWVVAAEPALPWEAGQFIRVYSNSRVAMVRDSLDRDLVGKAIISYLDKHEDGIVRQSLTSLLSRLEHHIGDDLHKSQYRKYWPQNTYQLGQRIHTLSPFLRQLEIDVTQNRRRAYTIIRRISSRP